MPSNPKQAPVSIARIPIRPPPIRPIVVVTGVRVVFVELVVLLPQSTMIGAVLAAAVEPVFMRLGMFFGLILMIIAVLRVVACMAIVFVVRQSRRKWRGPSRMAAHLRSLANRDRDPRQKNRSREPDCPRPHSHRDYELDLLDYSFAIAASKANAAQQSMHRPMATDLLSPRGTDCANVQFKKGTCERALFRFIGWRGA